MPTTTVAAATMKVAQVPAPGADFQIVEREVPQPGAGHVRIKVQACGVCHSDVLTKEGAWPGIEYPRIPGHEVAGIVDEVGVGVSAWKKGQRVGVGWHGGQDNTCRECRRGDFRNCRNVKIPGINYDGGYQQYMLAPVEALVAIPDTHFIDNACDFMSRNAGILDAGPRTLFGKHVTVANTTGLHFNSHMSRTRLTNLPLDNLEICSRRGNLRYLHRCCCDRCRWHNRLL